CSPAFGQASMEKVRDTVSKAVAQIRRADYEGDRAALQRLYEDLAPYAADAQISSRVQYWRGFAMWRRAINGFNESVDAREQERDLMLGLGAFRDAAQKEPAFTDAKIAALSSLGYLMYVNRSNPARIQELAPEFRLLMLEVVMADPDNPRLLWVRGPSLWNTPPERGGGQDKAIESYQKGLATIRQRKNATSDSLEPAWGEPELLMSLAWSYLNRASPDLDAAESHAHAALKIVPYWHYVRDILLPQIQGAKAKARPA
ncbi:MAG TPA: hypothetical protein VNL38_02365, partial [Candidatus Nitrosotenuis sp.]|nr:hypothetical protein [Candidatus Nitrosotenuis sp.]